MLHVNSESRALAQEKYQIAYASDLPSPLYFDFENDTLFFLEVGSVLVMNEHPTNLISKVQNVMIKGSYLIFWFKSTIVESLRHLTIQEIFQGTAVNPGRELARIHGRWAEKYPEREQPAIKVWYL